MTQDAQCTIILHDNIENTYRCITNNANVVYRIIADRYIWIWIIIYSIRLNLFEF